MKSQFDPTKHSLFIIYEIPKIIRSNDFRQIFEDLVEKESFLCFHFRHRRLTRELSCKFNINIQFEEESIFCLVIICKSAINSFLDICNSNFVEKRPLKAIEFVEFNLFDENCSEHFWSLEEFNPPSYIPNGNVGTSSTTLKKFISLCKVPTSVLKALKIRNKQRFASIHYDYNIINRIRVMSPKYNEGEEWEKHMQLHNDVDEQGRTDERLHENEKEIVWEKGSSGLVHYTDAQYWYQRDGRTDFDVDTVDDWDIDMAIYTQPEAADRDAVELHAMRELEAAKRGIDIPLTPFDVKKANKKQQTKSAKFESGFGCRTLEKYGWVKGKSIGKTGLIDPIEEIFRKPLDKSGLGYKKFPQPIKVKPIEEKEVKISTIYDSIDEEEDTPFQSAEPTKMKYRRKY